MQYAKGLAAESSPTTTTGDPTMVVVVPAEQFDNGALVSTVPDTEEWAYEHFLNIVAPVAEVGGIRIDGAPVSDPFTPIGTSGWAFAQVSVAAGVHSVTHTSPAVPVGVTLYGWADFDGYAMPARMRLIPLAGGCVPSATTPGDGLDNDCDGRVDEELANGLDDDGDGLVDEDLFFESGPRANLAPVAHDRHDALREDSSKAVVLSGSDPNGDPITFEILVLPSHGTLVGAGATYTYTPAPDYNGPDDFRYRACDASECSGAATFTLTVRPENDLPVITMDALYTAFEDELFELALSASDVESSAALDWSLVAGPSGLGVESDRSVLYWTPDDRFSNQTWPVTVRATDEAGAATEITFGIVVVPRPDAPYITSAPVIVAAFGVEYRYDVEAIDPDVVDSLTFFMNDGPAAMTLDASTGLLRWTPTLADVGLHDVEVVVRDSVGLLSSPQRFTLEVSGDLTPPRVVVATHPGPVIPGDTVTITVSATDDDSAAIEGADVDGVPVALDAAGTGTWIATTPGAHVVTATAVDPSGNRGTSSAIIRVLDPTDTTPPFVELVTPEPNAVLTYLHETRGTVRDDNLVGWWLEARPAHRGAYRTLLSGTSGVEDASLGELDTTQLQNGTYFLRLRAEDINGRVTAAETTRPIRVEGGAKLGVVTLSFIDLVVADFGIPLAIERTYDSRVQDQEDFGVGATARSSTTTRWGRASRSSVARATSSPARTSKTSSDTTPRCA